MNAINDPHLRSRVRFLISSCLSSVLLASNVSAAPPADFEEWFQAKIEQRVAEFNEAAARATEEINENARVAAGATSSLKQEETPAFTSNTSTLVDTSAASDFISVALNAAGLSGSTGAGADEPTAASASISGYAFYAAASGKSPLSSKNYCTKAAQRLRLVSATLGYENDEGGQSGPILIGAKLTLPIVDRRNVCNEKHFEDLDAPLRNVAVEFGEGIDTAKTAVHAAFMAKAAAVTALEGDEAFVARVTEAADLTEERFKQCLTSNQYVDRNASPPKLETCIEEKDAQPGAPVPKDTFFLMVVSVLGEDDFEQIALPGDVADQVAAAELALQRQVATAAREFETRPRFAVQFNSKQFSGDDDEYLVKGVVDFGLRPGLTAILNGGWERKPDAAGDLTDSGTAALAIEYELPREFLTAQRPVRVALAANGNWVKSAADTYKGQFKVVVPVPMLTGVELPLSLTVANRTELIDETDIRGLVGFTIDTSRLFSAFSKSTSPFDQLSP